MRIANKASGSVEIEAAVAVCGEGESGEKISFGEAGEVGESFLVGHACGHVSQHGRSRSWDGDARAADAGLAGVDGDDLCVVHGRSSVGCRDCPCIGAVWVGGKAVVTGRVILAEHLFRTRNPCLRSECQVSGHGLRFVPRHALHYLG